MVFFFCLDVKTVALLDFGKLGLNEQKAYEKIGRRGVDGQDGPKDFSSTFTCGGVKACTVTITGSQAIRGDYLEVKYRLKIVFLDVT